MVDIDPIRWLALSAKMAVTVQKTATVSEMISPRCCIAGAKIMQIRENVLSLIIRMMKERVTKTEPKTKTTVLEVDELQNLLGIKGWLGRRIASAVYRLLEFKEVNRIHHKFHDSFGPDFSAHVLEEVGVRYEIPPAQLERIPKEGGFITVSNHHFGSLDGMILSAL